MAGVIALSALTQNDVWDAVADSFENGVIRLYGGTPPPVTQADPGVSHAVQITVGGGAFTAGAATNGLNLGTASAGAIGKASAEGWSGTGLSNTTVSWFRHFNNAMTKWIQGTVNTTGAVMTVTTTVVTVGLPVAITSAVYRF